MISSLALSLIYEGPMVGSSFHKTSTMNTRSIR